MSSTFVDNWRLAIRQATTDQLTSVEKAVAIDVSWFMDWTSGRNAYAGPARIARDTGLHIVTVKRALGSLVDKKWLVVTRKGKLPKLGEKREANVYAAIDPPSVTEDYRSVVDNEHGIGSDALPINAAKSPPSSTTGSPECDDWESCVHRPVAEDYSISSRTLNDLYGADCEDEGAIVSALGVGMRLQ
jgi:hypothetical protein